MTATDALRFLAHEARQCRDRDAHEALCLLLPALCKVTALKPADDFAALALQQQFHDELRRLQGSPIVQCQCEGCRTWESLPEVSFKASIAAAHWCDVCAGEKWFTRKLA